MFITLLMIGLFASFVGTLAGSGGLINLPAMLVSGIPVHNAIASNKFSNMISSFSSFFVLLRKREVDFKSALKIASFSFAGGLLGGLVTSSLSEVTMLWIGIGLLVFALFLSFLGKPLSVNTSEKPFSKWTFPGLFGIGVYDGMFGPGQATMQMYLFFYQGVTYLRTIALTRFNTFLSCFGAFISYYVTGFVTWDVAIPLAIGSLLGAQIAVRIAGKFPKSFVKILLRVITILLVIQLFIKLIGGDLL
ncbi:sulfite exporter TauE/SafE family protein [Pseudalkalibacillus berkeleyi]|uniref:Probable membrane transporter protein n=1 Tax=Pseudalkalibacillus berkeleyi TaxID=1069813 RepID=A0ABS9GYT0_9BACL|nr:sulfite exporter TauE/SafE family protein [Pseudalkalibacillus berkeleyi]MCF6136916.1 sulfite exporter TauE/SafE family protein [Pseudalkalibacillus berkeleyi]